MIQSKKEIAPLTLILGLLFFCKPLVVFGQTMDDSQLLKSYGIKIGIASARQSWDYNPTSSVYANSVSRNGLDIGIYGEWFNIPFLSFVSECHYIQKGGGVSKYEDMWYTYPTWKVTFFNGYFPRVNYISVPLLAKMRINWRTFNPYILIGPRFDYSLSSNNMLAYNNIKKLDVGATMGIGVGLFSKSSIHFGAEFRYSPSFNDIYSLPSLMVADGTVSSLKIRNQSLEFLLVISY